MKWNKVLDKWSSGKPFTYPKNLKNKFQWNTSVLKDDGNSVYQDKFKVNMELPVTQDWSAYQEYIVGNKEKHVISFYNPSKDTLLIIPKPRIGKHFATIKDFADEASQTQQRAFWKEVAILARREMESYKKVWISAHGLGLPFFHLRISQSPKYYFDNKLAKS